jgi:hypothetical protein
MTDLTDAPDVTTEPVPDERVPETVEPESDGGLRSLRNADMADWELLMLVWDLCKHRGDRYTSVADVAGHLNIEHTHPERCVSARFSWLGKYGAMERGEDTHEWRLSPEGREFVKAKLNKTQVKALRALRESQVIAATREITRHFHEVPSTTAILMRREWLHSTQRNGR